MSAERDDARDMDATMRWLVLGEAPVLTGDTAVAVVQLLGSVVEAIEEEYAPEIEGHRRREDRERDRMRDPEAPWRPRCAMEQQLSLDLGEDDTLF